MTLSTTHKLYLKIFILMGVPYAILMSLNDFSWPAFLSYAILFGGLMTATIVPHYVEEIKGLGYEVLPLKALKKYRVMTIHSTKSLEELQDIIKNCFWTYSVDIKSEEDRLLIRPGKYGSNWTRCIVLEKDGSQKDTFVMKQNSYMFLKILWESFLNATPYYMRFMKERIEAYEQDQNAQRA